ncbi:MAG: hypothetical protein FK733_05065 [Asgard group archaeon]|nr:hypothetical protein [Asgard group archaeon]
MSAEYSFGMDNNRLLKAFLRLKNAGILFLLTTVVLLISGILYPIYYASYGDEGIEMALWFLDLISFVMIVVSSCLIYSSINIISKNVNEKNEQLFKLSRIILLVFIILYSLSSIFVLPIQWTEDSYLFALNKNMIAYMVLTAFLLTASFCFKNLHEIGYGTRLLYVPLIFLTVPSVVSLIMGCLSFSEQFLSDIDVFYISCTFVNLYIVVFLFLTFLEMLLVLRRMTRLIDVQVNYVLKSPETESIAKSAVPAKK